MSEKNDALSRAKGAAMRLIACEPKDALRRWLFGGALAVLLCGLVCTWPYGLVCGLLGPLLSSVLTGMPAAAVLPSMMAELAVYGLVTALVMRLVHTGRLYGDLYIALCCAIPCGRIVAGVVKALTFPAGSWSMAAWVSANILISWPGTLIQLALLPTLVVALTKARLVPPRY